MDIGPFSVNPKVPFDRTARSPLRGRSLFESSRGPKPLRVLSGTEVPSSRAIPLAPCRSRSHATIPEAAAQRSRSRSSAHTRRAIRSAETRRSLWLGPPRLPRRDPKAAPLPACSPSRSTSTEATMARDDPLGFAALRRAHRFRSGRPSLDRPKTASGPSQVRRPARAPPTSEDAAGDGQGVRSRRHPKTPPKPDPAGSSPKPEGSAGSPAGALLSEAEAPSIPLRARSPVDSSSRPKPRRFLAGTEVPSNRAPPFDPLETEASFEPNERLRWPRELPHLQGFDPRGDPPLTCRLFRPTRSALLSWAFRPPGCSPSLRWARLSPCLPLMGFSLPGASDRKSDPPGCCPQRGWLISLEIADPPGLRSLLTFTSVGVGRGSGVTSSGLGVRHRPLTDHL